jgi:probable HAF family extracellular repeat protein
MRGNMLAGLAAVALFIGAPAARAQYSFTTLDAPAAANGTYVYDINNVGQIVGRTGGDGHGTPIGFLYSGGVYSSVNNPLGGFGTSPQGVNDAGSIVGWYQSGANPNTQRGFLYSGGIFTTISDPLGVNGQATAINNAGQIVGNFVDSSGNYHGYLFSGGSYITLDDPSAPVFGGQSITIATGINDAGQIVGWYQDSLGGSAFLYNGGSYTTLNVPGATGATIAEGINDSGQIVGWYQDASGNHGFRYSGGAYTTIDDPSSPLGLTMAWGINNAGQIAGYYGDNGTNPSGAHGFLATPTSAAAIPEPTSWAMILSGFCGLGVVMRSRRKFPAVA